MERPPPFLPKALALAENPPFFTRRKDGLILIGYQEDGLVRDLAWDEETRELRGIIYREATGAVISRPFHRFFNVGDPRSGVDPQRPLGPGDLLAPKVDGRLFQVFFLEGSLRLATRGSLELAKAERASWRKAWTEDHERLAQRAQEALGPVTLLFEVVDPERPILEHPQEAAAVLLAVRHVATGRYGLPGASEVLEELLKGLKVPRIAWAPAPLGETVGSLHEHIRKEAGREGFVLWLAEGDFLKLKTDWALGIPKERGRARELRQAFLEAFLERRLDDLLSALEDAQEKGAMAELAARLEELLAEAVQRAEAHKGLPPKEVYVRLEATLLGQPMGPLRLRLTMGAHRAGREGAWRVLEGALRARRVSLLEELLASPPGFMLE
ncbi:MULTISPECIES: RNA ligase [unclassified Meiothermus]|uniref:RNA ligase n=1 Tax=unclassified Meiothermus TaxID=370471 RepID=UPI000D7BC8FC|nr:MULTISPECIES: RNA ligase [unclassified Meiothermus]PZA06062.1 hypothetical protein DNA98_15515 [Meiothermus sp. Pnk-1]RYM31412.1 hypothetical protein EWH23_14785 [Meiothermus sp. PNK-Is4]